MVNTCNTHTHAVFLGAAAVLVPRRSTCHAHACHHSAYVECLEGYRQRIWACRSTGAGKLTYEQALTSETKARALASRVCCNFVVLYCLQYVNLHVQLVGCENSI